MIVSLGKRSSSKPRPPDTDRREWERGKFPRFTARLCIRARVQALSAQGGYEVMKTQPQERDASALSRRQPTKRGVVADPKRLLRLAVPFALASGLCASAALAWDDDGDH